MKGKSSKRSRTKPVTKSKPRTKKGPGTKKVKPIDSDDSFDSNRDMQSPDERNGNQDAEIDYEDQDSDSDESIRSVMSHEADDDEKGDEDEDDQDLEGWKKPEPPSAEDQKKKKYPLLEKQEKLRHKDENGILFPSTSLLARIKNKLRRRELYARFKKEKKKKQMAERKEKKRLAEMMGEEYQKPIPKTIENQREPDDTWVEADDQEVQMDMSLDEFASYFRCEYKPKVCITTSDNPHTKTVIFCRQLRRVIPNSDFHFRNRSSVKYCVEAAKAAGYTDLIIINEDRRTPNYMVLCHLPEGPTAYFRLSNPQLCEDLGKHRAFISAHRPEVILNNFNTRIGHTVGRMLASLFHYQPQFKGRRAVTFHNQRDYIFFRHHRYEFKFKGEKVALQEIGPRFTLKLQALQRGTFDPKYGEFEWVLKRHEMQKSRRKFML